LEDSFISIDISVQGWIFLLFLIQGASFFITLWYVQSQFKKFHDAQTNFKDQMMVDLRAIVAIIKKIP